MARRGRPPRNVERATRRVAFMLTDREYQQLRRFCRVNDYRTIADGLRAAIDAADLQAGGDPDEPLLVVERSVRDRLALQLLQMRVRDVLRAGAKREPIDPVAQLDAIRRLVDASNSGTPSDSEHRASGRPSSASTPR
jgi:hypothetical protein